VKAAALACFAVAAVAGLVLALLTTLWLVLLGAVMIAAAWGYTGGASPYGYRGLGEVSVFVFFGWSPCSARRTSSSSGSPGRPCSAGVACGALACAILVTNNLRDIPTDTGAGKRTLAVQLGDRRTRVLFTGLLVVAFAVPLLLVPASPWALLAVLSAPLAAGPLRRVRGGVTGLELVPVLAGTGKLQLVYSVLLSLGLALGA
jgi:1,4-dihydroxy-2-naphthoate octaprenyltransferase